MDHVLDNPVWSALTSGNAAFCVGNEVAKFFPADVSPFVSIKENSVENFKTLYNLVPNDGGRLFIGDNAEIEIPAEWNLLLCLKGRQMVYNGNAKPLEDESELVDLTDEHIPQMLALTKLTNPGPFAPRTIDLGHYKGVFEGAQLVAMAGQRLHALPYAEVSAVCTHPDHTGKGYARQLLWHQINRIKAIGEIPFLHVRHDNYRAIKVYEDIGFITRKDIYFYFIKKI
jgi:ribosomal protein S18 acetylase RimI-like enzyme